MPLKQIPKGTGAIAKTKPMTQASDEESKSQLHNDDNSTSSELLGKKFLRMLVSLSNINIKFFSTVNEMNVIMFKKFQMNQNTKKKK